MANGPCRIVLTRRFDAWGRELVHRIRVRDEGPVYGAPNGGLRCAERASLRRAEWGR